MINFLYTFYFDAKKEPDECFKMLANGKKTTIVPLLHSGETARGLRVILSNFKYDEEINCTIYYKLSDSDDVIRTSPFNRNKNIFDFYFPTMSEGEYELEIIVSCGDNIISSGIYKGYCDRTIKSDFYKDYTPITSIENIISTYDKYSSLYKKSIEQVKNDIELMTSKVQTAEESLNTLFDNLNNYKSNYEHTQIQSTDTWTIQHNLNKYPSVSVTDTGNNIVYGDIEYIDENNIVLKFSVPFSGKAFLN